MSDSWSQLGLLVVIGLAPLAFLSLTAFVKIGTVLQIVRSAIGAAGVPSSAVVMALSAALTVVAMAPVGSQIGNGLAPLAGRLANPEPDDLSLAWRAVAEPLREFMQDHASPSERNRFLRLARRRNPVVAERDFVVLIPAFIVSELLAAFSLGLTLYVPFLVVDLVVANLLVGLGLSALSPAQVSTPLKLLLFVSLRGWGLLAETLLAGY